VPLIECSNNYGERPPVDAVTGGLVVVHPPRLDPRTTSVSPTSSPMSTLGHAMPVGIVPRGKEGPVSNPLAAQRRLAAALLDLRDDAGWSHAELARRSGVGASTISRLESPFGDLTKRRNRPNLLVVRQLLDSLGIARKSSRAIEIENYVEAAAARCWWDAAPYGGIGGGQRTFALVELGTAVISEYAGCLLPGLVQTEAYARHRITMASDGADVNAVVAGRLARQQQIAEQGSIYNLVLEEQAIWRAPVPRPMMLEQLRHLLALVEQPGVSIRVLPVRADLGDGPAPRAPYAHMTYPAGDPPIVIVDNVTDPHLVTDVAEVEGYARLHQRLRGAALSDADSAALIEQVAASLATTT
jgi:transcriptional regulator with XRE-family HTH domain